MNNVDNIDTKDREKTYDFAYKKANALIVYKKRNKYLEKLKLNTYEFIKRLFDIFCSLIGVFFVLIIGVIVKLSYIMTGDFKSVFYKQKRHI